MFEEVETFAGSASGGAAGPRSEPGGGEGEEVILLALLASTAGLVGFAPFFAGYVVMCVIETISGFILLYHATSLCGGFNDALDRLARLPTSDPLDDAKSSTIVVIIIVKVVSHRHQAR